MNASPDHLRRSVRDRLGTSVWVEIIPRDASHQRSPAYAADYFEIVAYVSRMAPQAAEALGSQLAAFEGVFRVNVIAPVPGDSGWSDPTWPIVYRSPGSFRPQARAMWRPTTQEEER